MARIVGLIGTTAINNTILLEHAGSISVYTQCVRWLRKPPWMPPNKTKMFKITELQVFPEDETIEIRRLYNNYKTYMKSLSSYLKTYVEMSQVQFNEDAIREAEEADFAKCSALNDEWNKNIAKQRELRLAKEREERRQVILQKLIEKEQREKEIQDRINEEIRQLKKEAPTFITEKNIDQAIEIALATTVDHNSCMDLHGNFYPGSDPEITKTTAQV